MIVRLSRGVCVVGSLLHLRKALLSWGVRDRWLTGCMVLALSACGGVVRSSPSGDAGSTTTAGGTAPSTGGGGSIEGGRTSTGGLPSAGTSNVGGQTSMPVPCGKTFCPARSICCDPMCAVCGTADGACPDIACTPPMQDGCASLSSAPSVLSCVQEYGKPSDPVAALTVSAPDAVITSEVSGSLGGGCLEPLLKLQPNGPALSAQAVSWIVADGVQKWDVEAVVEGSKIPSLGGGQKVSLSYAYQFGGFGPTRRELSLVTKMSPSHGVWTAEGGDLPVGNMPLSLARGKSLCTTSEQCGSYDRYDIRATEPLSMKMLTVSHGQTATLGPWVIVHGGYEEQTSTNSMCADWFVADVRVAILGLM